MKIVSKKWSIISIIYNCPPPKIFRQEENFNRGDQSFSFIETISLKDSIVNFKELCCTTFARTENAVEIINY
jgi:hypothetical protein